LQTTEQREIKRAGSLYSTPQPLDNRAGSSMIRTANAITSTEAAKPRLYNAPADLRVGDHLGLLPVGRGASLAAADLGYTDRRETLTGLPGSLRGFAGPLPIRIQEHRDSPESPRHCDSFGSLGIVILSESSMLNRPRFAAPAQFSCGVISQ